MRKCKFYVYDFGKMIENGWGSPLSRLGRMWMRGGPPTEQRLGGGSPVWTANENPHGGPPPLITVQKGAPPLREVLMQMLGGGVPLIEIK